MLKKARKCFAAVLAVLFVCFTASPALTASAATQTSWNFKDSSFKSLGTIKASTTINGLGLIATSSKKMAVKSNSVTVSGTSYTYCLALSGTGSTSYRAVKVPVSGSDTIKVVLKSSGSSTRNLVVADSNGKKLLDGTNQNFEMATDSKGTTMEATTANSTWEALGIADFDVTKNFDLQTLDDALDKVTSARGSMGAQSNAFDYALNYNAGVSYNLTNSVSRLEDLDVPKAISDKKKQQTLQEYAMMMQKKRQEAEEQRMRNFFV